MRFTLSNDFHGTSCCVIAKVRNGSHYISIRQARQARRKLCGHARCLCSGAAGTRGPQIQPDGSRIDVMQYEHDAITIEPRQAD